MAEISGYKQDETVSKVAKAVTVRRLFSYMKKYKKEVALLLPDWKSTDYRTGSN